MGVGEPITAPERRQQGEAAATIPIFTGPQEENSCWGCQAWGLLWLQREPARRLSSI